MPILDGRCGAEPPTGAASLLDGAIDGVDVRWPSGGAMVPPAARGCVAVRGTLIAGAVGGASVAADGGRGAGAVVPCDGRRGSMVGDGFAGGAIVAALIGIDGVGRVTTGDIVVPRVRSGAAVVAPAGFAELADAAS